MAKSKKKKALDDVLEVAKTTSIALDMAMTIAKNKETVTFTVTNPLTGEAMVKKVSVEYLFNRVFMNEIKTRFTRDGLEWKVTGPLVKG